MRVFGCIGVLSLLVVWIIATISNVQSSPINDSNLQAKYGTDEKNYIVMIDAGSSGSRAHVHAYTLPLNELPKIDASIAKKVKPGLSSYAEKPADAATPVQGLLDFIKETVPQDKWKDTPIHLQATAGLRSVPKAAADEILNVVRATLSASPFIFRPENARIISGKQEGVNGWLAANYLLGTLAEGKAENTLGVIEMGGASLQITFAPASLPEISQKQTVPLSYVNGLPPDSMQNPAAQHVSEQKRSEADYFVDLHVGRPYKLYTHSYLNYGLDAIQELFQHSRAIVDHVEENGNPCYPKGFRHSSVGDHSQCSDLMHRMIDNKGPCHYPSSTCSFNGVYQPRIKSEPFLAIENFFWTSKFFSIENAEDLQFLDRMRGRGKDFCAREWRNLTVEFKSEGASDLARYCFASAYMPLLLQKGFGLGSDFDGDGVLDSDARIRIVREINGRPVDWELGAALIEILAHDPRPGRWQHSSSIVNAAAASRSANGPNLVIWASLLAVPVFALWILYRHVCKMKPQHYHHQQSMMGMV